VRPDEEVGRHRAADDVMDRRLRARRRVRVRGGPARVCGRRRRRRRSRVGRWRTRTTRWRRRGGGDGARDRRRGARGGNALAHASRRQPTEIARLAIVAAGGSGVQQLRPDVTLPDDDERQRQGNAQHERERSHGQDEIEPHTLRLEDAAATRAQLVVHPPALGVVDAFDELRFEKLLEVLGDRRLPKLEAGGHLRPGHPAFAEKPEDLAAGIAGEDFEQGIIQGQFQQRRGVHARDRVSWGYEAYPGVRWLPNLGPTLLDRLPPNWKTRPAEAPAPGFGDGRSLRRKAATTENGPLDHPKHFKKPVKSLMRRGLSGQVGRHEDCHLHGFMAAAD
jgi:hypothetical protein